VKAAAPHAEECWQVPEARSEAEVLQAAEAALLQVRAESLLAAQAELLQARADSLQAAGAELLRARAESLQGPAEGPMHR